MAKKATAKKSALIGKALRRAVAIPTESKAVAVRRHPDDS
jgi:hypothetical protein